MSAFDTLSTVGTEITTEQLEDVDGGLFLLIMGTVLFSAAVGFGVGYVFGATS